MQLNAFRVHRQSQTIFHVYVHIHVLSALGAEKTFFFEEGSAGKVTLQEIQTSSAKHQKDKKNISWKREHGEKQTGFKNLVHRKSCSKKKAVGIFSLGSASSKSWSK